MPFHDDNHDDDDALPSFLFRGSRESRERKVEGVQDSSSPYTKKYTDWVRKKKKQTSLHIDKKGGSGEVQEFRDEEPEVKPKPEESKEIVKVSKKVKQDYQPRDSFLGLEKAVELREYQDGWKNLQSDTDLTRYYQVKEPIIKAVYNYIGKRLYGDKAQKYIEVSVINNDLVHKANKPITYDTGRIDLVLMTMNEQGLIEAY